PSHTVNNLLTTIIQNHHLIVLDRQPDRRKLVAGEPVTALRGGQVVRQEAGITGRLGQAIAVADRKSETQLKPPRCLPQQRPSAADEAAEPGQVLRGGS